MAILWMGGEDIAPQLISSRSSLWTMADMLVPLKHRQYTELRERKMTIALGILCRNGVVLAADSEISAPGNIKGIDTKIVAASQHMNDGAINALSLAGAGSVGYYQSLRVKVAELVIQSLGCSDSKSASRVEKRLERFMLEFHEKHVIPYAHFHDPPAVSVLVGTWTKERGAIWSTDASAVRRAVLGYDAIGVGSTFALDILHAYFRHGLDSLEIDAGVLLASYILKRVKDNVRDCGKDTEVSVLCATGHHYVPRNWLLECDRINERFLEFQGLPVLFAVGASNEVQVAGLNSTRLEFDKIRSQIRAMSSQRSQT
jgi:20S proteasome alpha/beta subunit